MTIFMDTHEGTSLPPDVLRTVQSRVKSGERDRFGVMDRGVVIDKDARQMHCILDAKDEDAVVKHHEAINVPLERHTIHQADAILR